MAAVTMAQIARELGVSKNTVSLALRRDPQIPAATAERVNAAARRLGYAINPIVSDLMSELRKTDQRKIRHTLALMNAYQSEDAFLAHPTIPAYVEGCRRRAAAQGYSVDTFWLHDPELNGARLTRILHARGIRGGIIVGTMNDHQPPTRFAEAWSQFAWVVTGLRTRQPTFSFCCVDHHALVLEAVNNALALGYRRPGLVIDERIDRLVELRFSSGMWVGQQPLPLADRVASFRQVEAARAQPELFYRWLQREKPDVILTLYNVVRRWLEQKGYTIPGDFGLIQLERRTDNADWAGMDQRNDLTGEAAVDMMISLLQNNEMGVPANPRATLIEASWVPGQTVRARPAARRPSAGKS
jgi:LacI family transcriptional regulator